MIRGKAPDYQSAPCGPLLNAELIKIITTRGVSEDLFSRAKPTGALLLKAMSQFPPTIEANTAMHRHLGFDYPK